MKQYESSEEFEKALTENLSVRNIGKDELSTISAHLADTYKAGIAIFDWHQLGTPHPDSILIKGVVENSKAEVLTSLMNNQNWSDILVFRRGIPRPDFFEVNIKIQTERV